MKDVTSYWYNKKVIILSHEVAQGSNGCLGLYLINRTDYGSPEPGTEGGSVETEGRVKC